MAVNSYVEVTLDVSAVPEKPVGAGRYTYELAHHLSLRSDVRPILISRKKDEMRWEALRGTARVSAVAPEARPARLAWEQLRLPSVLRSLSPQVHHGPHYTVPQRSKIPTVATIHDMTFFDHPEWHEKSKVAFFRRAISESVKRTQALIAVSEDTSRRLQERFGELAVTVIPHGVDHARFRPAVDDAERTRDKALLHQSGIDGDFVAFVGTLEPRKDVPSLIKAFDRLAKQFPNLQLVLAGRPGWGSDELEATLARSPFVARIIRPGYLPGKAIPALMRQARVVAYPSLEEGFGLPALEALACGAVLVSTTGSAIQEVVGDAAVLVTPGDVTALSAAITQLLEDEVPRSRMQQRGPQVAAEYTWTKSAAAHVSLYRTVSGR